MPFTFSHPAAVLPLLTLPQRWRSATGLIVGSMTPDFEKFIRMSTEDPYSHTWRSIFYFNLPLGILLAFTFHIFVRDALITHSPLFIRQRFNRFLGFNWWQHFKEHYVLVLLSLLLGTTSHIVWDSFTHKDGRGVQLISFLEKELVKADDSLYVFEVLQTLSSVIGVAIILFVVLKFRKRPLQQQPSVAGLVKYWVGLMVCLLLVLAIKALVGGGLETGSLYDLSIPIISAGLISLIVTSAFFKNKEHF